MCVGLRGTGTGWQATSAVLIHLPGSMYYPDMTMMMTWQRIHGAKAALLRQGYTYIHECMYVLDRIGFLFSERKALIDPYLSSIGFPLISSLSSGTYICLCWLGFAGEKRELSTTSYSTSFSSSQWLDRKLLRYLISGGSFSSLRVCCTCSKALRTTNCVRIENKISKLPRGEERKKLSSDKPRMNFEMKKNLDLGLKEIVPSFVSL